MEKEEYFDEELALSELLKDGVLFCNSKEYYYNGNVAGETIVLFVLCNDVFAWGCADAEDLLATEIKDLYDLHTADKKYGSTIWCCLKRNEKPQAPIVKWMKENNAWNEKLENLPENHYDKMLKEDYDKRKQ